MTISVAVSQADKPEANINATLFGPVPAGLRARLTISAVNQDDDTTSQAYVAIAQSPTTLPGEWIEFGRLLNPGGGFERTDKWLKPGDRVIVKSTNGHVAFRVDGVQEDNV